MKLNKIFNTLSIAVVALLATACADTDAQYSIPDIDAPKLVSISPENGSTGVGRGSITMTVKYDKRIFFSTQKSSQISVSGATLTSANVLGQDSVLTIELNCPTRETTVSVTIPEGLVTNTQGKAAAAVSTSFSTVSIPTTPVAATNSRAIALYNYIRSNFESKILSGMMAPANGWSTEEADKVFGWIGQYPAIAGFDYLHLRSSAEGAWINYGDITPVKNWVDNGGIVTIGWHWNVPMYAPVEESIDETVWEGSQDVGNWANVIQLEAAKFVNAKTGQSIIVKVTQDDTQGWWQGSLKNSSWGDLADGAGVIAMENGATMYSFLINDDILAEIQTNGLIVGGCNHTVSSISFGTPATTYSDNDYSFYKTVTDDDGTTRTNAFDPVEAVVEGTWENYVVQSDLTKLSGYLKLLQDQNIPVLWRPLHEAAGGWFWWGKDAESFKALWIYIFDYLKAQGINNLIWVWTSETGDEDWYPGDEYVDIIGRDLYSKDADACATDYSTLSNTYDDKIIVLSECGSVDNISKQLDAGATWGWFMPWYPADDHAPQSWWQEFDNDSRVIWRDDVKF